MADTHRTTGARTKNDGSDKALLAAKLAKTTGELSKARTEASHYLVERDTARADAEQLRRQMAKQQWLVAGLEQARDGQLEDTAAAEAVIVKLAAEVQEARQEVKQEKKRATMASSKEAAASRMLEALYEEYEALKRRLQQQKEKVTAAETEADEARLRLASVEPTLLEQQKHSLEKDTTIAKLMKDLADVRVASAALQSRCREQQQTIRRLEKERQTNQGHLKITEKTNLGLRKDVEKEHERGRQLALQLVRRNDQVQVLQERNFLLHHLQLRGNHEYSCRTKDIYYLSAEVANLRDQLSHMVRQAELNRALKVELTRMQRNLVASYHKRAALETQVMLGRVGGRGRRGIDGEGASAARQSQALQQKLLKATQAQAETRLQLHQIKQKVTSLERGSGRHRTHSTPSSRGYFLNQLRAAHAHIQAAQGVANWAIRAREEMQLENQRLRRRVLQKSNSADESDVNK